LLAIWRAAAAKPAHADLADQPTSVGTRLAREAEHAVYQAYREVSFAGEPRSNKVCARRTDASAEGVGAQLARDLARSGSKTCARGVSDEPRKSGSGPLRSPTSATERRPAGLPRPAGRRGDLADQPISVGARLAREAEQAV